MANRIIMARTRCVGLCLGSGSLLSLLVYSVLEMQMAKSGGTHVALAGTRTPT